MLVTSSSQEISKIIFHVRHDFLLGLPTITSILRRISVVWSQGFVMVASVMEDRH